jgi:hypothetical protein
MPPRTGAGGLVNAGSAILLDIMLQHRRHAKTFSLSTSTPVSRLPPYSTTSRLRERRERVVWRNAVAGPAVLKLLMRISRPMYPGRGVCLTSTLSNVEECVGRACECSRAMIESNAGESDCVNAPLSTPPWLDQNLGLA